MKDGKKYILVTDDDKEIRQVLGIYMGYVGFRILWPGFAAQVALVVGMFNAFC